ncbi:putative sulfate exporter family transporter [candidate division KSB1 bacterium]|nr:MAG: putative sulfate exporter family transporter [candidate division KSB1 bacterium]
MRFDSKKKDLLIQLTFIILFLSCFLPFVSAPIALVGGILFSLIFKNPFPAFSHRATGWLLKMSVVGLGFGMNAYVAFDAGKDGLGLTIMSISVTLLLGFLIGRKLKIARRTSHLVASGTAICGGSAIAAVAPVVKANENEMSVSLAIVFFLNSLALIIFPLVGHMLDMSQHDFGLWSAIAIHDTSSVVGAAQTYGEEALQVATTVKLARALWIIPVALISALLFKGDRKKLSIPYFIGFFVLAMLINTFLPSITSLFGATVVKASKLSLTACLFLIGAGLSLEKLRVVGWKPMVLGVLLWVFISVLSLAVILM